MTRRTTSFLCAFACVVACAATPASGEHKPEEAVKNLESADLVSLAAGMATSHQLATVDTLSGNQVIQAVRQAADWQLKHPNRRPMGDWSQGPFVNGLFAISQMPGNETYFDTLLKIGERAEWGVITTIHPANDHCTPQTWLDIYRIKEDARMLAPTRKALVEYIRVAKTLDDSLDYVQRGSKKWTWCDALYMSPPAFARMYAVTGDPKYLDYLTNGGGRSRTITTMPTSTSTIAINSFSRNASRTAKRYSGVVATAGLSVAWCGYCRCWTRTIPCAPDT